MMNKLSKALGRGSKSKSKKSRGETTTSSPPIDSDIRNFDLGDESFGEDEYDCGLDRLGDDETLLPQNMATGGGSASGSQSIPSMPQKRNRKSTSKCWEHFTKVEGQNKVMCNHCQVTYNYQAGRKGGTGSMSRHMSIAHKKEWGIFDDSGVSGTSQTHLNPAGQIMSKYNKKKDREEVAKMVTVGCLPFSFACSSHFVTYIQRVYNPLFMGFPRSTTRREIFRIYDKYVQYLRYLFNNISCRVALTADLGHSTNGLDYLTVTAHWVDDDFIMQKRIIAYKYDEDQAHDAEYISSTIYEVVAYFQMNTKIMSLSFDNAANNTAAIPALKASLNPPLREIFHVRCACHIYNLIVKDGLDFFETTIKKIRSAVLRIQGNNQRKRIAAFKDKCIEYGLRPRLMPEEVKTRWNYTYLFLKTCYKYRMPITAISNMHCKNTNNMLVDSDWSAIADVNTFLQKFYFATLEFSHSYTSTTASALAYVAEIALLLHQWKSVPNYQAAVTEMMKKFKKYFFPIPLMYQLGCVLNPCNKMRLTEHLISLLYEYMEIQPHETPYQSSVKTTLDTTINDLFSFYSKVVDQAAQPLHNPDPATSKQVVDDDTDMGYAGLSIWGNIDTSQARVFDEYQLYLNHPPEPRSNDFNPLQWWKMHAATYPVLSAMARDVLNVPVSTVASESSFSQGRQQIGDTRHSLGSNAMEVLVCLRDWIRSERRNQGREDVQEQEAEELELEDILSSENSSIGSNESTTPTDGGDSNVAQLMQMLKNL